MKVYITDWHGEDDSHTVISTKSLEAAKKLMILFLAGTTDEQVVTAETVDSGVNERGQEYADYRLYTKLGNRTVYDDFHVAEVSLDELD